MARTMSLRTNRPFRLLPTEPLGISEKLYLLPPVTAEHASQKSDKVEVVPRFGSPSERKVLNRQYFGSPVMGFQGFAQLHAEGFATKVATGFGISPETTCANVTPSRIARSDARNAIQTSCRAAAEPT
jgi:hypothetical protein